MSILISNWRNVPAFLHVLKHWLLGYIYLVLMVCAFVVIQDFVAQLILPSVGGTMSWLPFSVWWFVAAFIFVQFWFIARFVQNVESWNTLDERVNGMISNACKHLGVIMPEVFILSPDESGKKRKRRAVYTAAASFGRKGYSILLAKSTLNLKDEFLAGIMAHEVAHLKHGDPFMYASTCGMTAIVWWQAFLYGISIIGISTYQWYIGVESLQGGVQAFWGFVGLLLSVSVMYMLMLAYMRSREFLADARGAEVSDGMQGYLSDRDQSSVFVETIIQQPSYLTRVKAMEIFSTHPSYRKRVEALKLFTKQ